MLPDRPGRRDRLLLLGGVGAWLVALTTLGLPRALTRHFHVDEVQVAYDAALLGVHQLPEYAIVTTPVVVAMGGAIRELGSAPLMYAVMRLGFFLLFACNLLACAWAQPYFRSTPGRLAVLVAATSFHPLWSNGFEIRMDVITVGGSIVLYGLCQRVASAQVPRSKLFFVGGVACATMVAHSFKALAYAAPFGLALLALGAARSSTAWGRVRPALVLLGGALFGLGVHAGIMFLGGGLPTYLRGVRGFTTMVADATRFSPTPELTRLALDSPVVFALAGVHVVFAVAGLVRSSCPPNTRVTLGFLAWTMVVLYVNPTPFAYNFVHVLPFVFFAALDALARMRGRRARLDARIVIAVAGVWALVFLRGWMFDPFANRSNAAQLSYVRAAEALTAPDDTVLDGVGLVLSRKPPHKDWFLHSLRMSSYRKGELQPFARMMIERPSPVVIDNYRWLWLSAEDRETRDSRYVRIAPRLHVLGEQLDSTAGDLHIHYPGRYRVVHGAPVRIDDILVPHGGTIELEAGRHRYTRGGDEPAMVHWLGPAEGAASDALGQIMSLGRAEALFTNEPLLMLQ